MKINQTNTNSVIALCAVAVLSFLNAVAQADPNSLNRTIAIDERGAPVVEPIMFPGGDPIGNPGNGRVQLNPRQEKPTKQLPVISTTAQNGRK